MPNNNPPNFNRSISVDTCYVKMSILNYFCRMEDTQKDTSTDLPNSEGSLSEKIPSPAIEQTNTKVAKSSVKESEDYMEF